MSIKPVCLIILDGVGHSAQKAHNAVYHAQTPILDYFRDNYPFAMLSASGSAVGLLDGMIGNSEVGHLTIGAGRIIDQPIKLLHNAIDDQSFFSNVALVDCLQKVADKQTTLHLFSLLSDAAVHAHTKHLYAFIRAAAQQNVKRIVLHLFLDGRDVAPQSAKHYLQELEQFIQSFDNVVIGSISGRFYAMDRDNNWQRTQQTYEMLCKPNNKEKQWQQVIDDCYAKEIYDEFIPPTALTRDHAINNGDGIIFCNVRPDRARQLTQVFIDEQFNTFDRQKRELLFFLTPVKYGNNFTNKVMMTRQEIKNTLKEQLSNQNKRIFTIAETEKYAHVTYFFSGGREKPFTGERWHMIPSLKLQNYIEYPEMSAKLITQTVCASLANDPHDFYLINYANADMVGHSGNFDATVKAVECLDQQIKQLYDEVVEQHDGTLIITADHGNAEVMFDEVLQQPHTAHTTNLVPFYAVSKKWKNKELVLPGELSEVAEFIERIAIKQKSNLL